MAISDTIKTDLLLKKLYGVTKTDTAANKSPGNEATASPALNRGDLVWTQAASIPTTAAAVNDIVQSYQSSSKVQCVGNTTTNKISGTVYPTWNTGLTNWIPPEFDTANITNSYRVKVYYGATGLNDPATSGGTQISADGSGGTGEWYFDYQAGTLNFIGGTIPAGMSDTSIIYVYGYRYVGLTGVTHVPNLTVDGSLMVSSRDIISDLDSLSARITSAGGAGSAAGAAAVSVTSAEFVSLQNSLSAAINTVSNTLSNEISVRAVAEAALSARITSAAGAGGAAVSVTSADLTSVSAALESHINSVSAAVNTVSNNLSKEISIRTSAVNAVSNSLSIETANRISAVNVVSNALSIETALTDVLSATARWDIEHLFPPSESPAFRTSSCASSGNLPSIISFTRDQSKRSCPAGTGVCVVKRLFSASSSLDQPRERSSSIAKVQCPSLR